MKADDAPPAGWPPEMVNARDLGGLPLIGGGTTQFGVLWRSDAPHVDDRRPTHLAPWPPRTVVDLREFDAGDSHPLARLGSRVLSVPLMNPAHPRFIPTPSSLADLYLNVLDEEGGLFASIVESAATREGPLLVHCAAGKDRTGLVVALLLLLGGVEPEAVVDDYTRTQLAMAGVIQRLQRSGIESDPNRPDLMRARAESIEVAIGHWQAHPDGAEGWVTQLGVGPDVVDRWKMRLSGQSGTTPGLPLAPSTTSRGEG